MSADSVTTGRESPVRGSRPAGGRAERVRRLLPRIMGNHALLIFLVIILIGFTIARPHTFPTSLTFQGILADKTVIVILALGLLFPLATNNFDISIGYNVALTNSLAMGLQVRTQLPWELAVVLTMLIGIALGCFNGFLVAYVRIDSFIATLGSGTLFFGIANWYTGGLQISAVPPVGTGKPASATFLKLASNWQGIPKVTWFVAVLAIVLWILFEYLPAGRRFYAIGANRRAADLSGINSQRFIVLAFAMSGLLASIVGIFLASQLQIGQATTGADYLLPSFAAILLGATSVRPGRVNVWGTVIAVSLLSVAIAGLQQFGAQFYVESVFNGAMVIIAVGAAGYVIRRRVGAMRGSTESQSQDVGV